MKQFLISSLMLLLLLDLSGQTRLEPADSVDNRDWFRENPWGLMLSTSGLPNTSFNLNYNRMYDFLDGQGIDPDKDLELLELSFLVRWRRLFFDVVISQGVSFNDDELRDNGGRKVTLDQDYLGFTFSTGYVVFSNNYLAIIPKIGIGFHRYSLQYTYAINDSQFDFESPGSFSQGGSPLLFHDSGHLHVAIEVLNGLHSKQRNHIFEGARIGYKHGLGTQRWDSDQVSLSNTLSDRSGQLYFSLIFGFAHRPKGKS